MKLSRCFLLFIMALGAPLAARGDPNPVDPPPAEPSQSFAPDSASPAWSVTSLPPTAYLEAIGAVSIVVLLWSHRKYYAS